MADNVLRNRIEIFRKLTERNRFTQTYSFDQAKIGGGQQSNILRILPVDLLDASRNHQLNSSSFFSVRRCLSRGATPLRQTGNDDSKPALLNFIFLHGAFAHSHINVLT